MKTEIYFPASLSTAILSLLIVNTTLSLSAAAPSIDFQPKDQTVILYQPAAFGVIASGTAPLSYQWRKDGVPIVGATNDHFSLAHAQFSDAGQYSVVVSNAEKSEISVDAVLTVNSPKGGDLDYSFAVGPSINGPVSCLALQPDGKILIAGDFSTVNGAMRGGVARLNADGTTDYTFMDGLAGVDGSVSSIAVQSDGKVLVTGGFGMVNGVSRNGIARLNADGTQDSGFQTEFSVGCCGASVAVQSDGKVLIAGALNSANGSRVIVRLNADGTKDGGFQDFGGDCCAASIAVQGDGKVLIAGWFTTVNGGESRAIARLNADGTLDGGFRDSGVNNNVASVAIQIDGKVLIGGHFSSVSGVSRNHLARLNADGTLDSGFEDGLSGIFGDVYSIVVQSDGKVLVAGGGTSMFTACCPFVARLNANGTRDSGFQTSISGLRSSIYSLAVQSNGKVLIAGQFNDVDGTTIGSIARIDADGTLDSGFQNGISGVDGAVFSVAVQSDGRVLIGGEFAAVNGVSPAYIARLNADGMLDSGFLKGLSGANSLVLSVASQSDGKVLVVGEFSEVDGVSLGYIARLNVDGTLDTGFRNGLSGTDLFVNSVAVQGDGKVLIGGRFTKVNGVGRNAIARLNGDGTLDSSFQTGLSGADRPVLSVTLQKDGKVLIGGYFTTVNGVSRNRIARLNADGTLDSGFQNSLSGAAYAISSMAVQVDGKVLIGGYFTTVNGASGANIARLNPDGMLDSSFQIGLSTNDISSSYVRSVAVQSDSKVLIGGQFTTVNGVSRYHIARLKTDGTLDNTFQNELSGADSYVYSIAVLADGKVLIGGEFRTVNGVPAPGMARLWGSADIAPEMKSINRSGTDVSLSWHAISNRTYRVQYNENLSSNNWTDLADDVSATGATASKTIAPLGNASQQFYRVVLLP